MGSYLRRDFSRGWVPSADAVNCPQGAVLRMDNCVLDELGILSVRQGSAATYTGLGSISAMYTTSISGTKKRMTAGGTDIFANGASLSQSMAGSGDVSFGSFQGQILFARSTSKKKYDGTTVRNWGISGPNAAPTLAAIAADSKSFGSFDTADQSNWNADEGTNASMTGVTAEALKVTPNSTTGRGTITKTFGSPTDYTAYTGGQTGVDADPIDFYVFITEPNLLESLTLMIDVNDGLFKEDYYWFEWKYGEYETIYLDENEVIQNRYDIEGFERDDAGERFTERRYSNPVTTFRPDKQATNGWNHLSIARGKMFRSGATTGKNWATVKAIRLTFQTTAGSASSALGFDELNIIGGSQRPLTGNYKYAYCFVRNDGVYQAISPISAFSSEITLKSQGCTVTIPTGALSAMDTQVNEIWIYRMGGTMNGFYRISAGTDVTDPVAVSDITSDADAMVENKRMETDNAVPPDSILGIDGPHYDRIFALTATKLYPSRRLNPDSFGTDQVITICGADETALWIRKTLSGIYVGTTADIYAITGEGDEYPDGTMNFTKTPLNIGSPPISAGTAIDGNTVVYLAGDGWRIFNGLTSQPVLMADVNLLYRGQTRHGVSPVNLSGSASRFRAALCKGQLVAIVPEGSDTSGSTRIHRYDFQKERWYRHVYLYSLTDVIREYDGTLIAGDSGGNVFTLDSGTQDGAFEIPIYVWTGADDFGRPYNRKDPWDLAAKLDTGNGNCSVIVHLNGSATASQTLTATLNGMGIKQESIADLSPFRQMQVRFEQSVASAFKLYDFMVNYRERPTLQVYMDNKPLVQSPKRRRFGGLTVDIDTLGADATVTPILDGTALDPFTVNEEHPQVTTETFESVVGRDLWAQVECATGFEYYQIAPIIIEELPQQFQGYLPGSNIGTSAAKEISGIQIKACTLAATRTFTVYMDGTASSQTFTLLTDDDEPTTEIFNFTALQEAVDIQLFVDGDIELYEWSPVIQYILPAPRRIWDTGPIDTGSQDLTWIREIEIKVKSPVDLTVTPYFDGLPFTAYTARLNGAVNRTTILEVPVGREYKGRVPRIVVTASSEFNPYWIRLWYRGTGNVKQKKALMVKAL